MSKAFGAVRAVNAVTLEVRAGEVLGLLGPNGAGKSTLLALAAGLELPDKGEIATANGGRIGFMPQEYALYPTLSAWDNAMYFAGLWRLSGSEARRDVNRVIELVGLGGHRQAQVKTFSGGMRRRLSLAIASLGTPSVLLLDEPTVGVDPQSRLALLDFVRAARDAGTAIVYSSHYMEEVQALADRVVILHKGQLLCEGRVADLVARHGKTTLELEMAATHADSLVVRLSECKALHSVAYTTDQSGVVNLRFHVTNREEALAAVLDASRSVGATLIDLRLREPTLEAVFIALTGSQLCD